MIGGAPANTASDSWRASAPTVIFVLPFPPTVDFRQKFFVRELEHAGIATEYWDIAKVMGYRMRYDSNLEGIYYRQIGSMSGLRRAVEQTDPRRCAFVVQITRGVDSFSVYRVFSLARRTLTFFGRGYLPTPPAERSPKALLYKIFRSGSIRSIAMSIASRLLGGRLPLTRPYDLAFVAGNAAHDRHVFDALRVVDIHHFDADTASARMDILSPIPSPYLVFLDDFLPFHPDFNALGSRTIDPVRYYAALNGFFAMVEQEYGATVVIAAHPKAIYMENPFAGREVIFGATTVLVKGAAMVLAHASTAISLAVIHQRPLLLIYTRDIMAVHPFLYKSMAMTADMLGCPMLDIECAAELPSAPIDVALDRYAAYYREYISVANTSVMSAEVVVREFTQLLDCSSPASGGANVESVG